MDLLNKFLNKFGFQYIPENAEDETEYCTFIDFKNECIEAYECHHELREKFKSSDELLECLIDNIEWQFPSTYIEDILKFD